MIRYALRCENEDAFEAWFGSIADYDAQALAGQIQCPLCGSSRVEKAPMAPSVVSGKDQRRSEGRKVAMAMAAQVRAHIQENFDYVGPRFAEEARKIHDGEAEERPIWGEATPEEARALAEDGVPAAALPPELAPLQPRVVN